MILDRTWNKKDQKLVISYIDKLGNRQFYSKYLHHWKTYEYDKDGEFDTWNNRKCKKVYKDSTIYTPNNFDILEFMYELDPDLLKVFHAQYFPKLYTFDIETAYSDEFPDPEKALYEVTAISLVGPDLSCIVYGLNDMDDKSKEIFRSRYLEYVYSNDFAKKIIKDKEPKVLYKYFKTEDELLKHFFTIILSKIPCLAGWNSYGFDLLYLINRIIRKFGQAEAYNMLRKASPTGELGRIAWTDKNNLHYSIPAPKHMILLDYMKLVDDYDFSISPKESLSLDWIGNAAVKTHKVKYDHDLQYLYEHDHEWYYFYNAVDSLIVMLIHYKLKSIESPCAVSSVTLVPLLDAMGQISLTEANFFEEFYNDNKKVVYDYNEVERVKIPYEGAFCGCVPGRFEFNVCDDFKSLYPSQVQTCNFSVENFLQKKEPHNIAGMPDIIVPWSNEELDEFRKNPEYFVSIMGNVYRNDRDYCYRKLQKRLMSNREIYKYTGQRIESQLLKEINRLIEEKEKE